MVAYFIFKLVRMYASSRVRDYESARKTLTVFAIITLLTVIVTIIVAIWCTMNFNKGLKPHLLKRPTSSGSKDDKQGFDMDYNNQTQGSYNQYSGQYGGQRPYGGSRMEID